MCIRDRNEKGYDHVFYVKLASGVVFSSLLSNQTEESISRTVNNILQDGVNLRLIDSLQMLEKEKAGLQGMLHPEVLRLLK